MEDSPQKRTGFPIVQTVVAVGVGLILAVLVLPSFSGNMCKSKLTTALSNGRQIHQAAYRMVTDDAPSPSPEFAWPGELASQFTNPISSIGGYVEQMTKYKYLDRNALGRLFSGPGISTYPGTGPFEGKHSVFNIYKITENDFDTALFLATKNFTFGAPLDRKRPFGTEGAVIIRKGGDALTLTADAAMNKKVGVMPGGTEENRGEQAGNILKD